MPIEPDRFPNERSSSNNSKACLIVGAVGLGVAFVVVAVGFFLYQMNAVRHTEMAHEMAESFEAEQVLYSSHSLATSSSERSVVIRQEDLTNYSATDFGEVLTIENAVAILVDPSSTKLARDAFTKAANGREVEWELKVSGISRASENEILAELLIPYEIVSESNSRSSYVNVTAMFSGESYADLVNVRQGQWISVRGKLKIEGKNLEILDPTLVQESK